MAQYEWSETFLSLEGEGPYTGAPTVYIRFARCNFSCPLFNNHNKDITSDGYAPLTFDPSEYSRLDEIPLISMGCDSQYAVSPAFSHMWHKGDENVLTQEVLNLLPNRSFITESGQDVILSLTGGEPTLRAKTIPTLINHPDFKDIKRILFETNAAVPLKSDFIYELDGWIESNWMDRFVIFSNSPKLANSGEKWEIAIRKDIVDIQRTCSQARIYFKFVVDGSQNAIDEVNRAMDVYGRNYNEEIYLMPMACTEEQQQEIQQTVANQCIRYGFIYSHRLQNSLWQNGVGC